MLKLVLNAEDPEAFDNLLGVPDDCRENEYQLFIYLSINPPPHSMQKQCPFSKFWKTDECFLLLNSMSLSNKISFSGGIILSFNSFLGFFVKVRHDHVVVVFAQTVLDQVFENIGIGVMNVQIDVHIAADILDEGIVDLLFVVADLVENQKYTQAKSQYRPG
jgi:hypothetical protein